MLKIIILMLSGILIGKLFKNQKLKQISAKMIGYVTFLLLFFLGITVGKNQQLMNHIGDIASPLTMIVLGSVLGGILSSWALYRVYLAKQKTNKNER